MCADEVGGRPIDHTLDSSAIAIKRELGNGNAILLHLHETVFGIVKQIERIAPDDAGRLTAVHIMENGLLLYTDQSEYRKTMYDHRFEHSILSIAICLSDPG